MTPYLANLILTFIGYPPVKKSLPGRPVHVLFQLAFVKRDYRLLVDQDIILFALVEKAAGQKGQGIAFADLLQNPVGKFLRTLCGHPQPVL